MEEKNEVIMNVEDITGEAKNEVIMNVEDITGEAKNEVIMNVEDIPGEAKNEVIMNVEDITGKEEQNEGIIMSVEDFIFFTQSTPDSNFVIWNPIPVPTQPEPSTSSGLTYLQAEVKIESQSQPQQEQNGTYSEELPEDRRYPRRRPQPIPRRNSKRITTKSFVNPLGALPLIPQWYELSAETSPPAIQGHQVMFTVGTMNRKYFIVDKGIFMSHMSKAEEGAGVKNSWLNNQSPPTRGRGRGRRPVVNGICATVEELEPILFEGFLRVLCDPTLLYLDGTNGTLPSIDLLEGFGIYYLSIRLEVDIFSPLVEKAIELLFQATNHGISETNVFHLYKLAKVLQAHNLETKIQMIPKCFNYFQGSAIKIVQSPIFVGVHEELMLDFLHVESLFVDEVVLGDALITWARYHGKGIDRESTFDYLRDMIDPDQFTKLFPGVALADYCMNLDPIIPPLDSD